MHYIANGPFLDYEGRTILASSEITIVSSDPINCWHTVRICHPYQVVWTTEVGAYDLECFCSRTDDTFPIKLDVCECGATKVGSNLHSRWCPKTSPL